MFDAREPGVGCSSFLPITSTLTTMADNHPQVNSALFPSDEPDSTQHPSVPTPSQSRASAGSAATTPKPGYRRPVARPSITTSGSRNFHTDWNSRPTTPRTFEYTPDRPSQALPSATGEILSSSVAFQGSECDIGSTHRVRYAREQLF